MTLKELARYIVSTAVVVAVLSFLVAGWVWRLQPTTCLRCSLPAGVPVDVPFDGIAVVCPADGDCGFRAAETRDGRLCFTVDEEAKDAE